MAHPNHGTGTSVAHSAADYGPACGTSSFGVLILLLLRWLGLGRWCSGCRLRLR
jgi:hypothetical protein